MDFIIFIFLSMVLSLKVLGFFNLRRLNFPILDFSLIKIFYFSGFSNPYFSYRSSILGFYLVYILSLSFNSKLRQTF